MNESAKREFGLKKSIECWIFDKVKTRFLLLHCPETSKHKAYWQPVTGGIEPGEEAIQACLREIHEETGAVLESHMLQNLLQDFRVFSTDKELHKTVYLAQIPGMDVTVSDEHIGYQWANPSEVVSLLLWGSNRATFERVLDYLGLD